VFISSVKDESYFLFRKLLHSGKSKTWPDLLKEVMEIDDLDSGPLLQYFKKLESYLEELEQLEPIKPTRLVELPTSTTAPSSTIIILSESLNDTGLYVNSTAVNSTAVNSTISTVEPNIAVNELETKSGSVIIIVLGCTGVAIVGIVILVFVFGRRHFRAKTYTPASTREV
jgi:hypothetical protein